MFCLNWTFSFINDFELCKRLSFRRIVKFWSPNCCTTQNTFVWHTRDLGFKSDSLFIILRWLFLILNLNKEPIIHCQPFKALYWQKKLAMKFKSNLGDTCLVKDFVMFSTLTAVVQRFQLKAPKCILNFCYVACSDPKCQSTQNTLPDVS